MPRYRAELTPAWDHYTVRLVLLKPQPQRHPRAALASLSPQAPSSWLSQVQQLKERRDAEGAGALDADQLKKIEGEAELQAEIRALEP